MAKNKNLDLLKLISDERATAKIVIEGEREVIAGFYIGDTFNVGGSTSWESPFENILGASRALTNMWNSIMFAISKATQLPIARELLGVKRGVSQAFVGNPEVTTAFWQGPSRPTFDITLLFIALKKNQDVRNDVLRLMRCVYPEQWRAGGWLGVAWVAPLGYTGIAEQGTVTLQIGRWFRATNLLVSKADASFSRVTITGIGTPLCATVSLSLTPHQVIDINTLKGYFIGAGVNIPTPERKIEAGPPPKATELPEGGD